MGEYVLEMRNICKAFPGIVALDGVDLKVKPGSVHALMGENGAGKSTLMKCLFGIYHEDNGEIWVDGEKHVINSTKQALDLCISMIHQEQHPIRHRPIMENIWLGRFPKKGIAVDHKKMVAMTNELFEKVGLSIDPRTLAKDLSASTLQLTEIAKAVSYNSKIIIMDEPTSSLTENETAHLFTIICKLKAEGCAIIYISHRMEEILEICDKVTILRDGKLVGTWESCVLTTDMIIQHMVARDMTHRFPPKQYIPASDPILEVRDICSPIAKSFQNVSFELRKGEILGIGGLVGAQRTELVEALFGLRPIVSGEVLKEGKLQRVRNARDAKRSGFALLTEERRRNGILGILPILDNTVIASQAKFSKFGILNEAQRKAAANKACKKLNVKMPNIQTLMKNLSGGNQQKVLFARWSLTDPDIFILDEPTRGIDVGAKYEIYLIMQELVKQGKSIIMITSEMPELIGISDRIMVMCEGRVAGIIEDAAQFTQVDIMRLATRFMSVSKTGAE